MIGTEAVIDINDNLFRGFNEIFNDFRQWKSVAWLITSCIAEEPIHLVVLMERLVHLCTDNSALRGPPC